MKKFILVSLIPLSVFANNFNDQIQIYIDQLKVEAKNIDPNFNDFDSKRGEEIFTSKHIGKKGQEISCTSCHNLDLTQEGKNVFTNKVIKPLSPTANKERLISVKEVEKWLRRNFKDVYLKEGNAIQKGDVLYYINTK
ncbi:DUF1924 domain-containing protein [Sulfurovum sp. zt1-1]|uniref:DUF1924 domain-containing protein n=1 Tax=Sulfurovum zhangzhouensis TaxID=3019067 RepID=A0ABT7QUW8_9BACT|nr:DUF1924 domain-containing protein [Sulfurovum zhangzhouensis]MDM5270583.1 DUF1924 domain-containing protein [Sulfurovum zhangzhouensis]